MSTQQKDQKTLTVTAEELKPALDLFSQGKETMQQGFGRLITLAVDKLKAFRKPTGGIPAGAVKALRDGIEAIDTGGLSSSFVSPTVQLASATVREKATPAMRYMVDNIAQHGDEFEGGVNSPVFTPGRFNNASKLFSADEKQTKFEVRPDGLYLDGKPFACYTVKQLKELNADDGQKDKSHIDRLLALLGEEDDEKKKGTLMKFVENLREDNKKWENEAVSDFCDQLQGFVEDQRANVGIEVESTRVAEAEMRKAKAMERRAQRLAERNERRVEGTDVLENKSKTEKPAKAN